jgi:hypothetical protein
MEKKSSRQRPVKANSTGSQGSRRAVAPSDDDGVNTGTELPDFYQYVNDPSVGQSPGNFLSK